MTARSSNRPGSASDGFGNNGPQLQDSAGHVIPLPKDGRLVLGSAAEQVGFKVQGAGVDGVHCCISKDPEGGWTIQDLGSATGTLVNGKVIERERLWTGDVIRLGDQELLIVDPGKAASQANAKKRKPRRASPKAGTRQLGGFVLQRRLGSGGMGEVWLAQQESLDRPVALKLLSPALARDAAFVRRFQEEARAAAALSHPNVVIVFDVGSAGGQHYLAMEFMAGGSLEDQVAEHGPLPWREAVEALRDCALGLVFAEQRHIVHRDVKPDNLMRSSAGTVKLADLGLATSTHGPATEGKILGTPHFLAPEQARGAAPDHRSDLYSLGATAFRLLTAETPFQGKTTRDILRAHQNESAPAPSESEPDIPKELDEIVLSLLEKDPDHRPQSASEVVAQLDRLLFDERPAQRGYATKGLLIAAGLGLIAALAYFFLPPDREPKSATDNTAARNSLDQGGARSDRGVNGELPSSTDATDEEGLDNSFFATEGETETVDVEGELDRRELEAQLALAALPQGLPAVRELEELRSIQSRHANTPTGKLLLQRIAALEAELARADEQVSNQAAALELAHSALSHAIGWPPREGSLWDVGETLRALFATLGQPASPQEQNLSEQQGTALSEPQGPGASSSTDPDTAVAQTAEGDASPVESDAQSLGEGAVDGPATVTVAEDPAITKARKQLANAIVQRALEEFADWSARVDAGLEQGRFDATQQQVTTDWNRLRLPPHPQDLEPTGWDQLIQLAETVEQRAEGIEAEIAGRQRAILLRDRSALAALVGPNGSLLDQLLQNDWGAALNGLDSFLGQGQHTQEVQQRVQAFREQISSARQAIQLLSNTRDKNQWRRQSALLPVDGRDRSVEIQAIDFDKLTVRKSNENLEVSWGSILTQPETIQGLFQGRFTRALSPKENLSVINLLRTSAALGAVDLADQILDPSVNGTLSARESEQMQTLFLPAQEWLSQAGADASSNDLAASLALDVSTCAALRSALEAVQDLRWSQAVAQLELLLREGADTLLVAFLSDASETEAD